MEDKNTSQTRRKLKILLQVIVWLCRRGTKFFYLLQMNCPSDSLEMQCLMALCQELSVNLCFYSIFSFSLISERDFAITLACSFPKAVLGQPQDNFFKNMFQKCKPSIKPEAIYFNFFFFFFCCNQTQKITEGQIQAHE